MAEIKNQFTGGKMNKDLDERLIPNGQYRDAMNIQVSTSEGSDVGTVQNILGNQIIPNEVSLPAESVTIGSISDEKNDILYYLVWTPTIDYIFSYKRNDLTTETIFRDINKNVLKFSPRNIVTGINIIDDMLFWTDNNTEPKKINISRCKLGTPVNPSAHTKLINEDQNITLASNIDIEEKHITVIKKTPSKALKMNLVEARDPNKNYTGIINTTTNGFNFSDVGTEDENNIVVLAGASSPFVGNILNANGIEEQVLTSAINDPINGMTGWQDGSSGSSQTNIPIGTTLVFKEFNDDGSPPNLPITDYTLKGSVIDCCPGQNKTNWIDGVAVRIDSIDGIPQIPASGQTIRYAVDLFDETEKLFEFKFPRFSYRYKYEDGEYSTFAPFTQVAFSPGAFDYHPRKGYNIGMTNRIKGVELSGFIYENMPEDIISVDVLFKDESSPNIYVVDTISANDSDMLGRNEWNKIKDGGFYLLNRETIYNTVPSNQLLRPWDNVPRKALAQDVSGNRIIYGNYLQNYNLKTSQNKNYLASFTTEWDTFDDDDNAAGSNKSIKSLREYQLGVVFVDKYGRETPVISNKSGAIKLKKERSNLANRVNVKLLGLPPEELTHFKFFIKETSNEYYNMAMDRWYDAEDSNIWLAFSSSDRNKIDIDTFLILKKGAESNELVSEPARYKVLAIENEAPDYIKTTKKLISSKTHFPTASTSVANAAPVFLSGTSGLPLRTEKTFQVQYSAYKGTSGQKLDAIEEDLYIEFGKVGTTQVSKRYRVLALTNDYSPDAVNDAVSASAAEYSFELEEPLGEDVNFISNDASGTNSSSISEGAILNIYKYKVENLPQFDGRFFVKIFYNDVFKNKIADASVIDLDYSVRDVKKIYRMKRDVIDMHTSDVGNCLTGGVGGPATLTNPVTNPNRAVESENYGYYRYNPFSAFAMYFRRYMNDKSWVGTNIAGKPLLAHLTPVSSGGVVYEPDSVSTNWKAQKDWMREFGVSYDASLNGWRRFNPEDLEAAYASGGGYERLDGFILDLDSHLKEDDNDKRTLLFGYTANWVPYESDGEEIMVYKEGSNRGEAENARDTEVWFIDEGTFVGEQTTTNDNLWWEAGSQSRATPNGGFTPEYRDGIETHSSYWNMDLGFGGIQNRSLGDEDRSHIWSKGFFNLGDWNGDGTNDVNEYYRDKDLKNFVNRLNPGSKFRFKEDPNQTVYTVQEVKGGLGEGNLFRHSNMLASVKPDEFAVFSDADDRAHLAQGRFWVVGSNAGYFSDNTGVLTYAEEIGFNFTKNWKLEIVPKLEWNPMANGKIDGGLDMTIKSVSNTGSSTAGNGVTSLGGAITDDLKIFVKNIVGNSDSQNGENKILQVGMALMRYTNAGGVEDALNTATHLSTNANQYLVIRHIVNQGTHYELWLGGYNKPMALPSEHRLQHNASSVPKIDTNYRFVQVGMNGYSPNSEFNINTMGSYVEKGKVGAVGYNLEFVEVAAEEDFLSENPAVWETEPKDDKDLEIYYEASGSMPITIDSSNIQDAIPIGSTVAGYRVIGYNEDKLKFDDLDSAFENTAFDLVSGTIIVNELEVITPNNLKFNVKLDYTWLIGLIPTGSTLISIQELKIFPIFFNNSFSLGWHNCFSFGNGVESNRIRDNFNLPFIVNGVKASTTLEAEYKEEHRKYGLIYSGLYNSISGVNNLNQFIQAEKITKDINPIYGSIQKLHSRDTDLVTLCEDKVLRILANKDAVFNADGNPNLTATENVLGQTIPFSGEYGISTNPESFASENYRAYFTDKVRGTVLRLSKDGLTPISEHGMKDWFRDNLKLSNRLVGSYDDKKEEYNITLKNILYTNKAVSVSGGGTYSSTLDVGILAEKFGEEDNPVTGASNIAPVNAQFPGFTGKPQDTDRPDPTTTNQPSGGVGGGTSGGSY